MDTKTDTNQEVETENSWTVVIYGPHYWGCGNSYTEAAENSRNSGGNPKKDEHILYLFSEPVKNVQGSEFGLSWQPVNRKKKGTFLKATINEKIKRKRTPRS